MLDHIASHITFLRLRLQPLSKIVACLCTNVTCLFETNYRLVKVLSIAECFKGSILQYF